MKMALEVAVFTILASFAQMALGADNGTKATPPNIGLSSDTRFAEPQTITTTEGETYTDCIITRTEPDGISFRHSKGIAKIPFKELAPEFARRFGYHPHAAADYSRMTAGKQKEFTRDQQAGAKRALEEHGKRLDQIEKDPQYTIIYSRKDGKERWGHVELSEDRNASSYVNESRPTESSIDSGVYQAQSGGGVTRYSGSDTRGLLGRHPNQASAARAVRVLTTMQEGQQESVMEQMLAGGSSGAATMPIYRFDYRYDYESQSWIVFRSSY